MRCDDVPRLLAIGGPIGRWRARRHAARCTRCAAWRSILDELTEIPPLPDAHRALWARSADEATTLRRTRPRFVGPALIGLAAAAAVVIAIRPKWGPAPPPPAPGVPGVQGPELTSATSRDLDAMKVTLDPLARELADLRRRADLLDARHDVDRLLARYAWPEGARGL